MSIWKFGVFPTKSLLKVGCWWIYRASMTQIFTSRSSGLAPDKPCGTYRSNNQRPLLPHICAATSVRTTQNVTRIVTQYNDISFLFDPPETLDTAATAMLCALECPFPTAQLCSMT